MLKVTNLKFGYGSPVLNSISFEIGSGEFVSVLGPNGSGKSTLLKILVRVLAAGSGQVFLEGRPLSQYSRRDSARLIGYVAQESSVQFPVTAADLVLQGRFARGSFIGFENLEDELAAEWAMEI